MPPDYAAILTYDATRLLLEAIRQAGPQPRPGPHRPGRLVALARASPEPSTSTAPAKTPAPILRMATIRNGRLELSDEPFSLPDHHATTSPP